MQAWSKRFLPAPPAQTGSKARALAVALTLVLSGAPALAMAQAADPHPWQLNMGKGVTHLSRIAYESHMIVLWICVVIGVIVFGGMAYAMFAFRKSKGAVAAQFSHNTVAEIIWTVVPIVILVGLAIPATKNLIDMYDTRDAEMTVKVTGYQWMWRYEYLGEGVDITSRLSRKSDEIRQSGQIPTMASDPEYLLAVDNELVLPVDTKVRFVITGDDVIHSWWVPAFGWKQDAIPGIINEGWTTVDTPGVYRGQCAELCGKDHGFMPIVVRVLPKAEYQTWLAQQKAKNAPPAPAAPAPAAPAPATPEATPAEGETPTSTAAVSPVASSAG